MEIQLIIIKCLLIAIAIGIWYMCVRIMAAIDCLAHNQYVINETLLEIKAIMEEQK